MLEEELDAAQSDGEGTGRNLFVVFEIEKVLAQFFFADLRRGLAIVLRQLPHGEHVGFLGLFGQATQLHVLDHSLS